MDAVGLWGDVRGNEPRDTPRVIPPRSGHKHATAHSTPYQAYSPVPGMINVTLLLTNEMSFKRQAFTKMVLFWKTVDQNVCYHSYYTRNGRLDTFLASRPMAGKDKYLSCLKCLWSLTQVFIGIRRQDIMTTELRLRNPSPTIS